MEKGKTIHRWGIQERDGFTIHRGAGKESNAAEPWGWSLLYLNFYGTWEEAVTECAKLARLGKRLRPGRLPRDRLG